MIVPAIITSLVLLVVRLILTFTFAHESWIKLKNIKAFAKNDGVPVVVAYFIAIAELAAAFAMLSGLLIQWAGLGIIILMASTICLHIFKWHSPYWASKKGWEYDLLLLVLGAVIFTFGSGMFALFGV